MSILIDNVKVFKDQFKTLDSLLTIAKNNSNINILDVMAKYTLQNESLANRFKNEFN